MSGIDIQIHMFPIESCAKSSRLKLKTCPRIGLLLRFQSNCTATSDGSAYKLGNYVWLDSESIATTVCSQIGSKWKAKFESYVETCIDRTSLYFEFEFFSNLHLKIIIDCVIEQQQAVQDSILKICLTAHKKSVQGCNIRRKIYYFVLVDQC